MRSSLRRRPGPPRAAPAPPLSDLWRRYPSHRVVLVTDGDGYVPYAVTPDRARTGAVVITDGNRPNLGLAKMAESATR